MKNKHRLNCDGELSLCLLVSEIATTTYRCLAGDDIYIKQLKWFLPDRKCRTPNSIECNVLKTYIQSPSSVLTMDYNKVLLFRQYCDTLWQLPKGFDESLCKNWKCPRDLYQCHTGHCTRINNVFNSEWNCPDASDSIGLFGITQLSKHNAELFGCWSIQWLKYNLLDRTNNSYRSPFYKFCDVSKEYGCILANVTNPSNFTINRPCINVTQIGDGIIDCYGGLDERNLLSCGDHLYDQRGFDFHCGDQECIPFHLQCQKRCSNNADSLLCDQLKTILNPSCMYPDDHRCTFYYDDEFCDPSPYRRVDYYCDQTRAGK